MFHTDIHLNRRSRASLLAILAIVSAGLLSPIGSTERITGGGDIRNSVGLLIQAKMALKEGQFPIRIAPWEVDGLRYPVFQFYSPLTYTILGAIHCVLPDPWLAMKAGIFLALLAGGWFFFALALDLTASVTVSLVAAVVYIGSPILLLSLYALGSIAQAFAICLIPACLRSVLRFHQAPCARSLLIGALTVCCLVLAHLITGLLFIGSILLLCLPGAFLSSWQRLLLLRTALVVMAALFLLAYQLLPLGLLGESAVMRNFDRPVRTLFAQGLRYQYVSLPSVLAAASVPQRPGGIVGAPGFHPAVGFPVLFGVFLLVHRLLRRADREWIHRGLAISVLIAWCALFFAAWSPVNFWPYLPRATHVVQFPYRILSQVHWLGVLALTLGLARWLKDSDDGNPLPACTGIGAALLFAATYLFVPALSYTKQAVIKSPSVGAIAAAAYLEEVPLDLLVHSDGQEIPLTYEGRWMKLETDFSIPRSLISSEPAAVLRLAGSLSNEREFATAAKPPMGIRLVSRTRTVAAHVIAARDFVWEVPLREIAKAFGPAEASIPLRYVLEKRLIPHELNPRNADRRILGIQPAAVTLQNVSERAVEVSAARPDCRTVRNITSCDITLAGDRTVQIPVIYYRRLLEARVNGRPTSYSAMTAGGSRGIAAALTAVALKNGKSHVEVEFVGSRLGNWISVLSLAALGAAAFVESIRVKLWKKQLTLL